jgi:hypothetical protein
MANPKTAPPQLQTGAHEHPAAVALQPPARQSQTDGGGITFGAAGAARLFIFA